MLLLDASHTSHTRADRHPARDARAVRRAGRLGPVTASATILSRRLAPARCRRTRPPAARRILRRLARREMAAAPAPRGPCPPARRGEARPARGRRARVPRAVFPKTGARLPELLGAVRGPRVAVFHDAIGLKLPELSPPGTVARLPATCASCCRSTASPPCRRIPPRACATTGNGSASAIRRPSGPCPTASIPFRRPRRRRRPPRPAALRRHDRGAQEPPRPARRVRGAVGGGPAIRTPAARLARATPPAAPSQRSPRSSGPAGRSCITARRPTPSCTPPTPLLVHGLSLPPRGFGLPVLESLQHGKPCVCSRAARWASRPGRRLRGAGDDGRGRPRGSHPPPAPPSGRGRRARRRSPEPDLPLVDGLCAGSHRVDAHAARRG